MQADTAVVPEIVDERYPFSQVRDANVLVFPSLKLRISLITARSSRQCPGDWSDFARYGRAGHVLQTGDEVRDIVNIAAVAVMDAMGRN